MQGEIVSTLPMDDAISVPFRMGEDPWYDELAARLLIATKKGRKAEGGSMERYALDIFEHFKGDLLFVVLFGLFYSFRSRKRRRGE